jgi:hypothetical protein
MDEGIHIEVKHIWKAIKRLDIAISQLTGEDLVCIYPNTVYLTEHVKEFERIVSDD